MRILKFKKDYALAVNALSDKDAGKFIKALSKFYFEDEEEATKNQAVDLYLSLIKSDLEMDKEEDEEREFMERKNALRKEAVLDGMFETIQSMQDLIDYEVSKLFVKEEEENGARTKE